MTHAVVAGDLDHVVAVGRVDDDGIGRTVAATAAAQIEIDLVDVGPGQIVDRDGVGAAKRVELDVSRRR